MPACLLTPDCGGRKCNTYLVKPNNVSTHVKRLSLSLALNFWFKTPSMTQNDSWIVSSEVNSFTKYSLKTSKHNTRMSCLKYIYTDRESKRQRQRHRREIQRKSNISLVCWTCSCAGHPRVLPQTLPSEINMVHIKKHRSAISFAHFRMHNLFRQKSESEFKLAMTRVAFLCFFKWTTERETETERQRQKETEVHHWKKACFHLEHSNPIFH